MLVLFSQLLETDFDLLGDDLEFLDSVFLLIKSREWVIVANECLELVS